MVMTQDKYTEAQRRDAKLYQSAKPEKRDAIVDRMISREREYKAAGGTLPPDKSKKEIAAGMVKRGVLSAAQYNVRDLPKASRTVSTVGSRVQQDVSRLMGDKRSSTQIVFGGTAKAYAKSQAKSAQRTSVAYRQKMSDPSFFVNIGGSANVEPITKRQGDTLGSFSKRLLG